MTQTKFGKHDDLTRVSRKFSWVRKYVSLDELFIFGVVRDPVDFIVSLYNFHTSAGFDGKPHSTKELSFDEFWNGWCVKSWQAKPQHLRFVDARGHFRISHVIRFDNLVNEFPKICARIGVKANLQKTNVSPHVLSPQDLSAEHVASIRDRYAEDYAFLANLPRAF
jgi:hypothetical protein